MITKKIASLLCLLLCVFLLIFPFCAAADKSLTISFEELRDKIAGGWAGKMIGVAYGAPTEFRALARTYEDSIAWTPEQVKNALNQDDLYAQLTFMMAMDADAGLDTPTSKMLEAFANAGYWLWHANVQARKNFFDGILPPESGSPEYNLHADDIDFQIESDYIGFMCPAMPQTANLIADKVGRIMNYGDGIYGGQFVAAIYAASYFEKDIPSVIERALLSLPAASEYARCIRDVIKLHRQYPDNWRTAWQELENKWDAADMCQPFNNFNIDAKLNGAYIVMGLLYGEGDLGKTLEIATRSGQDSDCNPSNAAAVIGIINGYDALPDQWKGGIMPIADSLFLHTNYSFNKAIDQTMMYAEQIILQNGGTKTASGFIIKPQEPKSSALEVAFPETIPAYETNVDDSAGWEWEGNWSSYDLSYQAEHLPETQVKYADQAGDEVSFTFTGNGVALTGSWKKDGGQADIYLNDQFQRSIDTYYDHFGQEKNRETFLWHKLQLDEGQHTLKLVVKGTKKEKSKGSRIYIQSARVFKKGPKNNELVKFSFE